MPLSAPEYQPARASETSAHTTADQESVAPHAWSYSSRAEADERTLYEPQPGAAAAKHQNQLRLAPLDRG